MSAKPSHLIVTVHGIRTYGHWQERLEQLVTAADGDHDIEFVNYKFGYFSAISFALPFLRWLLVRRFRNDFARLCAARPRARIDLVGHSFGTHVIAWAIAGLPPDTKVPINTIVMSGSVLRSAFPWHEYLGSRLVRVINDCGSKDAVLLISQFLVFFTGMAGRTGFSGATGAKFRNRYSPFGHSGYFLDEFGKPSDDYMNRHWVPLLISESPAPAFDLRSPPTVLDSFTEKLSTHAGLIKLAVYLTPFVVLSIVYYSLYQQAESDRQTAVTARNEAETARNQAETAREQEVRAREQAETARTAAEGARKSLASQLAANYYASSQSTAEQDKNPLAAFTLAVKAAQTSPPDEQSLNLYLDRIVHLARRMPNRVVNLPISGGVNTASFNASLSQVAVVADNLRVSVFGLPGIDELFVPVSVNTYGNRSGYSPVFSKDGARIDTLLNWNHPEPDPDTQGDYYLQAGWNPKTKEVYLPEPKGSWNELKWIFEPRGSPRGTKSGEKKADAGQEPPAASNILKNAGKIPPLQALGVNASAVLAVDASGTLLEWARPALERSPASKIISPGQKWAASKIVGDRLFVIDSDNKTFAGWNIGNRERMWTAEVNWSREIGRRDVFALSPDGKFALINHRLFRLSDGKELSTELSKANLSDFEHVIESAITATGSVVLAGRRYSRNGDNLVFGDWSAAIDASGEPKVAEATNLYPKIAPEPGEFIHFLQNGRYYLYGSSGSVSIAMRPLRKVAGDTSDRELIRFYFGGVSRLSDILGRALLRQVIAIETAVDEVKLSLSSGAVLKVARLPNNGSGELRANQGGFPITRPKYDEVGPRDVVALSSDARWLAVAGENFVRIWDAATGLPLTEKVAIAGAPLDLAFVEDNTRVQITTKEGHLFELRTRFDWAGRPAWLEFLGEGVTAQTLKDDGTFSRLNATSADAVRKKLLGELQNAKPATSAVSLLLSYFGSTGR